MSNFFAGFFGDKGKKEKEAHKQREREEEEQQQQKHKQQKEEHKQPREEHNQIEGRNVLSLPAELLLQILGYLDLKGLCRMSQVSVRWHGLANDPLLWRSLSLKDHVASPDCLCALDDLFSHYMAANLWKPVYAQSHLLRGNWRSNRAQPRLLGSSPDVIAAIRCYDNLVVTSSHDGAVRLFDYHQNTMLAELVAPVGMLAVAMDPTTGTLYGGGKDGHVMGWAVGTGDVVWCSRRINNAANAHGEAVCGVDWEEKQGLFSASLDGSLACWGLCPGESPLVRRMTQPLACLKVTPRHVVTGSFDRTVRLWETRDLRAGGVLKGHKDTVCCVDYDAADDVIASGSLDGTVRLWHAQTKGCLRVFEMGAWVRCVSLGHGRMVVGCWKGLLHVVHLQHNTHVTIAAHDGPVTSLQCDDKKIISGGKDGQVRIRDYAAHMDDWAQHAFPSSFFSHCPKVF